MALVLSFYCAAPTLAQDNVAQKITFDDQVKQIFNQRCSSCHGANKKEGDLDVTNYTNLMIGGGSGEVIAAGSATDSYLYSLITHEDSPEMPPNGNKIPENEIKMIADWINLGALENAGSKPKKAKPKMDLAFSADATKRPETVATPLRMSLEPVIKTARPATTAIATSSWAPLAAVAAPKQVLLYHTKSLELLGVLPMEEGIAHSLKFSRNGSLLLAGGGKDGQSGLTILWDVKTGQRLTTIGEEADTVLAADVSPNHELIALGGPQKLVKVFRISDGNLRFEFNKHTDWVTAIEFSPDGKMLATGDRNGGLHVWEMSTGNELYALSGHSLAITGVSWRADSKILASASEDKSIRTWEMKKGSQVKTWAAHGNGTTSIEFLRDGKIVTSGRDKVAKTWEQDGKQLRQFTGLTDVTVAVSCCDESNRVICGDWTGEIRVWNAPDGKHVGNLDANPPLLKDRLQVAQRQLESATAKHNPLARQAAQATSKLDELFDELGSTQQSHSQLQTRVAESQSQIADAQQQLNSINAQRKQWREQKEQEKSAMTAAEEILAKANQAVKTKSDDKRWNKVVKETEAIRQSLESKLAELDALLDKSVSQQQATQSKLNELTAALNSDRPQLDKMTARLTQLEDQVGPATNLADESMAAAAAAQADVEKAEAKIEKWTANLEFIQQLKSLNSQLTEVEKVVQEKQQVVDQTHQQVLAAQQQMEQAKQAQQTIETLANELRQKILQLRSSE